MPSFGLLLPHFGVHADAKKVLAGSLLAEKVGFDSVWVRDHLLFTPHGEFEHPSADFLEALTVLTAVGAVTERLILGTAALIPFRHPLQVALVASTLTQFVGPRLILGFGAGNDPREFEAVGLGAASRPELVETNVKIMREIWAGRPASWHDTEFDFDDVTIEPLPPGEDISVFYCGNSPKGARMSAAALFDGWMPGRLPLETLKVRTASIQAEREKLGRSADEKRTVVGTVPVTSIGSTKERALASVNVSGLLASANKNRFWKKPESGSFQTPEDLAGMLMYGRPSEIVEQAQEILDAGVDHLVFDFRMSFERWEEQIQILGEEVLPHLRDA